jgi:hypothetical protein
MTPEQEWTTIVALNWRKLFGSSSRHAAGIDAEVLAGWTIESRPEHLERFKQLQSELATKIFVKSPPAELAFYRMAGLINNQLSVMQAAGLLDTEGERIMRSSFALGYIFGLAAWHSDTEGVPRQSSDADHLVVIAHQEALGPVSVEEIATLSAKASRLPAFAEGMQAAAKDAEDVRSRRAPGAYSLAQFVAKTKVLPPSRASH